MSDFKKVADLLRMKVNNVKSEAEAEQLFSEMKPQLKKLTEMFFDKNVSVSDDDESEIDWINELSEYIINTIQVYLLYHVKGELRHIRLSLSEQNSPEIMLTIDEQEYTIDFIKFKNGTDNNNRDAHRECYYRNESIWYEYREFDTYFDVNIAGEGLCSKLKEAFPSLTIDYIVT